jgi:DNA-binding transcriptional ArsR family regulator
MTEEDTYSIIFSALKHPSRRKIIRILGEGSNTYTMLQNKLGVETGFLNYYLDSLSGLVMKDEEGRYCLSGLGRSALSLISQVEEPEPPKQLKQLAILGLKINFSHLAWFIIALLVTSNTFWAYSVHEQSVVNEQLMAEKLLSVQMLLDQSIGVLNSSIEKSRLYYHEWHQLVDSLNQLSSDFDSMAMLDKSHSKTWNGASIQVRSTAMFILDALYRYRRNDSQYREFLLGEGWIVSLSRINEDITRINKALNFKVVLGENHDINISDDALTEVYSASLSLRNNIESARRNVSMPLSIPA